MSYTVLLGMRNVSDKKLLRKSEHTFCVPIKFFWKFAVYEITFKNSVEPEM
jgi:hypothetical protein